MLRVSAISYLNSIPYLYGLLHSEVREQVDIHVDFPAECARKLATDEADIGIVPVAALPSIPNGHIISDYCISSVGAVRTVSLLSNSPLNEISTVYLDYQSRTSVRLVKVLCAKYWHIQPTWQQLLPEHDINGFAKGEGAVIIGDRVFEAEKHYAYNYDLSAEWRKFTGLPFVFAVWASNKNLTPDFVQLFNSALKNGINSISLAVDELYTQGKIGKDEAVGYLSQNISFPLTGQKQKAIELFFKYLQELGLLGV